MHAGEASTDFTAEFNITSRTSFGVDLDNSYRYGLKQELADFNFILHLTPYQKLTNREQHWAGRLYQSYFLQS